MSFALYVLAHASPYSTPQVSGGITTPTDLSASDWDFTLEANDTEALCFNESGGSTQACFDTSGNYLNMSVPIRPSGLVTLTPTVPAACAGVVAVILVLFTNVMPVAAVPPTVTVAPLTKFVP